jgi:phosphatidylserine/phosphatidylglycerophosphate/cardiolipin synthase-like enzyme
LITSKFKFYALVFLGLVRVLPPLFSSNLPQAAFLVRNTPQIQVYFTPGKDCENNIIQRMEKANKIDIAVYAITNRAIADSILAASARGSKIRMITDRLQAAGKGSLVGELVAAGMPVRTNVKHKIEHNKFAIFDNREVISGSYNWTVTASDKNSENCIFLTQPDGMPFSARFQYLWDLYGVSLPRRSGTKGGQ